LFPLFFLTPFEQWLPEQGYSQVMVDVLLPILVVGW
jgi:hypothetical protein